MLLEHAQLVVQGPDVVRAALKAFRSGKGIELSDCLILETAGKAGHLPLGTFDHALAKLEGTEEL